MQPGFLSIQRHREVGQAIHCFETSSVFHKELNSPAPARIGVRSSVALAGSK